jgi:hypothetical protein
MTKTKAQNEVRSSMFEVEEEGTWQAQRHFRGTACGRRGDDHRFPQASAKREKVERNGAKACQRYSSLFFKFELFEIAYHLTDNDRQETA